MSVVWSQAVGEYSVEVNPCSQEVCVVIAKGRSPVR